VQLNSTESMKIFFGIRLSNVIVYTCEGYVYALKFIGGSFWLQVATFKTRLWKISVSSEKHESESSHV